jgi:hypothetical protein
LSFIARAGDEGVWAEKTREDARLRVSASRALVPLTTRAGLVEDGEILCRRFRRRKRKRAEIRVNEERTRDVARKFVQFLLTFRVEFFSRHVFFFETVCSVGARSVVSGHESTFLNLLIL